MRCALRRSVIPRADPASRSPLTRPFPTSPLRFRSKPAYVPPHLRNRPAGDRDRDRGGFDRRDDRRGGGACPRPIGCLLFSTQPHSQTLRKRRVPAPPSGGPLAAHVIAAATSRSRRDRAVSGRIAGSPSSHRMRGRPHASRRPSRARFRARPAPETLNSRAPRAPPRVWVFGSSLGFSPHPSRSSPSSTARFEI